MLKIVNKKYKKPFGKKYKKMRCPHCGKSGGWVSNRDWDNKHHCGMRNCVRETWRADCGHNWTQWTCEG